MLGLVREVNVSPYKDRGKQVCVCMCVRHVCLIINLIFIQGEDLHNLAFQFSTYFTVT